MHGHDGSNLTTICIDLHDLNIKLAGGSLFYHCEHTNLHASTDSQVRDAGVRQ